MMDDAFRRPARASRTPSQDIVKLRRGDHNAERLRLDPDRSAQVNKEDGLGAPELALAETKQWPEVQRAFQEAFALFRQHKTGKPRVQSN